MQQSCNYPWLTSQSILFLNVSPTQRVTGEASGSACNNDLTENKALIIVPINVNVNERINTDIRLTVTPEHEVRHAHLSLEWRIRRRRFLYNVDGKIQSQSWHLGLNVAHTPWAPGESYHFVSWANASKPSGRKCRYYVKFRASHSESNIISSMDSLEDHRHMNCCYLILEGKVSNAS